MDRLRNNLSYAGKHPIPLAFPDASRLLVLPEHGRLIGLYPADGSANFFWTNPAFDEPDSSKTYFSRPGWPNPGGDRTWLAPELALFIGDPGRPLETYAVPRALDPGNWRLMSAAPAEVDLENRTRLRTLRAGQDVGVRLVKTYTPAVNPLWGSPADRDGMHYAGYTLATTLELDPLEGNPVRLGVWNLLQLPPPGAMLIPTRAPARPQVVFGEPAAGELTELPGHVRWNMALPVPEAKISIKAKALTGRAGYLCATPGTRHPARDTRHATRSTWWCASFPSATSATTWTPCGSRRTKPAGPFRPAACGAAWNASTSWNIMRPRRRPRRERTSAGIHPASGPFAALRTRSGRPPSPSSARADEARSGQRGAVSRGVRSFPAMARLLDRGRGLLSQGLRRIDKPDPCVSIQHDHV